MRIQLYFFSLLFLYTSSVGAQPGTERFSIGLGAFITEQSTDTRLNGGVNDGSDIDFEKDLGLKSSGTFFRADGYYRFNRKHRLDFSIYDLSRDGSAQINRDINFGDETFNVNTTVSSKFDLLILKAGYTYTFLQRDSGYLGASVGAYVADTTIKLSEPTLGSVESRSVTAVLPVVGLRGEYAITPKWTFRGNGQVFKYEVDNIDGSFSDIYAGVDYKLTKQVAIGLGYNRVNFNIDASKNDFDGKLDWDYDGILLNLKYDFGSIK